MHQSHADSPLKVVFWCFGHLIALLIKRFKLGTAFFLFFQIWQSTRHSLLEISVLVIVDISGVASSDTTWVAFGTGLQLLLIGLCRNRTFELLNKLYTYWVIYATSWSDKKQRRQSTIPIMVTSIFLYPLILAVTIIAAALSAPLLPLFTLPVFFIGFPRPLRSWPGVVGASASVCPDTIFYRHMAPELAKALRTSFGNGGLGKSELKKSKFGSYSCRSICYKVCFIK